MTARSTTRLEKRSARSIARVHSAKSSNLEKHLSAITETEEEEKNVIKAIMDELMENVMEKIYEIYMEKQALRFVVHCTQQALIKIINLYFYRHNDYLRDKKFWGPDEPIPPSEPDSWAVDQIPVYKELELDQGLNTLSKIKLEMAEKGLCDEEMWHVDTDVPSEPSLSLVEDMTDLIEELVENLPLQEKESSEEIRKKLSNFSLVAEGDRHFDEFKMSAQLSKIRMGHSLVMKLPKVNLPDTAESRKRFFDDCVIQEENLQTMRTCSRFKCRLESPPEEEKKKEKK